MYTPKPFEETRLGVLHALVQKYPLGTWVSAEDEELAVNHIPFFLDVSRGDRGTLIGHVARANPVWKKEVKVAVPDVVVFRGPQAYITPSWYPSKHEHGKAVPTWNYVVVTVHGTPKFIDDTGWIISHLRAMTDTHEADRAMPWKIEDAPEEFTQKLSAAIIGVEIPILRIEGKWKTSQNKPLADKIGIVTGLLDNEDGDAATMASLIRQHITA